MSSQEEVEFLITTAALQSSFISAKESMSTDYAAYRSAKTAWSEHRRYWREIREWFQAVANQEGSN